MYRRPFYHPCKKTELNLLVHWKKSSRVKCLSLLICFQISVLIFCPLSPLLFFGFSSWCEVRGSCGPGAHLAFRPKNRPQDDDARGGPCCPWEATAAGVTPDPATAADPEAAFDRGVSEAAWELDTAAPGSASGAHQGSKRFFVSNCDSGSLRHNVGIREHRGDVSFWKDMDSWLGGNWGCTSENLG